MATKARPKKAAGQKPAGTQVVEETIPANVNHDPKGIGVAGAGIAKKFVEVEEMKADLSVNTKPADEKSEESMKAEGTTALSEKSVVDSGAGGHMNIPTTVGKRLAVPHITQGRGLLDIAAIKAANQEMAAHIGEVQDLVTVTLDQRTMLAGLTQDEQELLTPEQHQGCKDNEAELARFLKGDKDVPRMWQRVANMSYISYMLNPDHKSLGKKSEIMAAMNCMCHDSFLANSADDSGPLQAYGLRFYSPKDSSGKSLLRENEIREIQSLLDALIAAASHREQEEERQACKNLLSCSTITAGQFEAGKEGRLALNVPAVADKQKNIWYPGVVLALQTDGEFYQIINVVGKKELEYRAATALGMKGRIDQLNLEKPPFPGVKWRFSWLQFVSSDRVQKDDWLPESRELQGKATISVLEFIGGKDGDVFLTIPKVNGEDGKPHYGGACLFTKQGDKVCLKAVTPSAAIAEDCQDLIRNGAHVNFNRLQPWDFNVDGSANFPFWPAKLDFQYNANFVYSLIKSGLWHVMRIGGQMLWHQVNLGLEKAGAKKEVSTARETMAAKATLTPTEFFLDGKLGTCLVALESAWDDKPGQREIRDVFALVAREKNGNGNVIVLQEVPGHFPNDFLGGIVGKHFPEGDRFESVDQPLGGILRFGFSQTQKRAAIEQ